MVGRFTKDMFSPYAVLTVWRPLVAEDLRGAARRQEAGMLSDYSLEYDVVKDYCEPTMDKM
jgi:hypothetical protein